MKTLIRIAAICAALFAAPLAKPQAGTTDLTTPAANDLLEDQLNAAFNGVNSWWVHQDPTVDMIRYTDGSNLGAPTVAYLQNVFAINHTSKTFTLVAGNTRTFLSINNVDNTSDAGKPVSTATQTALNLKMNANPGGSTGDYIRGDGSIAAFPSAPTASRASGYLTGTAYTITTTQAAVTGGTTSPTITLPADGTYLLIPNVQVNYVGATFLVARNITYKVRKTSGTPADVTNSSITAQTQIITALSFTAVTPAMPACFYTGTAGDVLSIFVGVDTGPTLGSIQIPAASLVAVKL